MWVRSLKHTSFAVWSRFDDVDLCFEILFGEPYTRKLRENSLPLLFLIIQGRRWHTHSPLRVSINKLRHLQPAFEHSVRCPQGGNIRFGSLRMTDWSGNLLITGYYIRGLFRGHSNRSLKARLDPPKDGVCLREHTRTRIALRSLRLGRFKPSITRGLSHQTADAWGYGYSLAVKSRAAGLEAFDPEPYSPTDKVVSKPTHKARVPKCERCWLHRLCRNPYGP